MNGFTPSIRKLVLSETQTASSRIRTLELWPFPIRNCDHFLWGTVTISNEDNSYAAQFHKILFIEFSLLKIYLGLFAFFLYVCFLRSRRRSSSSSSSDNQLILYKLLDHPQVDFSKFYPMLYSSNMFTNEVLVV